MDILRQYRKEYNMNNKFQMDILRQYRKEYNMNNKFQSEQSKRVDI